MELRKNGNHAVMKGCNLIVNGQLYEPGSQETRNRIQSPNMQQYAMHVKANETQTQTRSIQKRLASPEQSSEGGEEKTIEAGFKKVRDSKNLSPKI